MEAWQWVLFGMSLAFLPSLIVLAALLRHAPTRD
jgi:hypothetical protein